MFSITAIPNKKWLEASDLFKDILKRYEWFLFEFGLLITNELQDLLLGELKSAHGPLDYKQRLVVAEIRDGSKRSWFALAIKAVSLSKSNKSSSNIILKVVARFDIKEFDPVHDILQNYGPWTVDTIPFAPSERVALVTIEEATAEEVLNLKKLNMEEMPAIQKLMTANGIQFDTRIEVRRKLKIVEDFEKVVNDLEFTHGPLRHPHWGPAVKKAQTIGLAKLMRDRQLIAVMSDPHFKKYRVKRHLKQKMTDQEVKNLEKFRRRLMQTL